MDKFYAGARALAVLVAIIAAFVTVPYLATILIVLGAISAIGNTADANRGVYLVAIVLLVGSKELAAIPGAGSYLAAIFGGVGVAAMGASAMGIALTLYRLTMEALAPHAAVAEKAAA